MPRLKGKGTSQTKKKCVKATAYPCGFACIRREKRCHNVLRNQAKTYTLWLEKVQGKLSEINKERIARGKTSLYANDRSRLTPATASTISPISQQERLAAYQNARKRKEAPSSPNPSGLNDKELITTFLREKKNKSSSALLAAQKPKATPKVNPDDQRMLNSLTKRLPEAISEFEKEAIKRDIQDIEILNPGIKPQVAPQNPFKVNQYGGWYQGQYVKPGEGLTRRENGKWAVYPKDVADRLMGKKVAEAPVTKPKWEQTFDEYKRDNWKELVKADLEHEIEKKAQTVHLDKVAKSEGRMFLSEEALKSDLERSDKAIAGLRNAKSYEDVAKVWENSRSLLPKQFHEETLKKAIADGKKIPDEVLKDYPDLIKAKPVLRTGPKPQQKSSGVTSKQKSLAAIVKGELINAQGDRIENSAIAMIDHLKKQGDTDTANRMQRVIDRIAGDDSDKMTRWVLDHQDLTPPKLRFNLDKIESSLGIGKPSLNTRQKPSPPATRQREKVNMGGFDFSQRN